MSQSQEASLPTSYFIQHYRETDWTILDESAFALQLRATYDLFVNSMRDHAHGTRSGFVSDTLGMGLTRIESELSEEEILQKEGITSTERDKMLQAVQSMHLLSQSENRFDVLTFGDDD